jgi:predicted HicB family RNase H-like nuclease
VDNDSDTKTVNWMLEKFPDDLKHRCKLKALSEKKSLKDFVIEVLESAVEPGRPKQTRRK